MRRGFKVIMPLCRLVGIVLVSVALGIFLGMFCNWWGYVVVVLILLFGLVLIVR